MDYVKHLIEYQKNHVLKLIKKYQLDLYVIYQIFYVFH